MRLGVISDIHGNLYALELALKEMWRAGVDDIVCLGDVATLGPEPKETVQALASMKCRCVMGNHDRYMLKPEGAAAYAPPGPGRDAIDWCRAELGADELRFIEGFETSFTLPSPGGGIFLFHGTPHNDEENLTPERGPEPFGGIGAANAAAVHLCGHTHLPMMHRHGGTLFVNPGSVGAPFRELFTGAPPALLPHAAFAVLDCGGTGTRVLFEKAPLEMRAIRGTLLRSKNPMAKMTLQQYQA